LLNNTDIHGAQKILLSIMSGDQAELEMDELTEITEYIQDKAGEEAEVIFGHGIDSTLGQNIRVTVIATGFAKEGTSIVQPQLAKKIVSLDSDPLANIFEPAPVRREEPIAPAPRPAEPVAQPQPEPVKKQPEQTRIVMDLESSPAPAPTPTYRDREVIREEPPRVEPPRVETDPYEAERLSLESKAAERRKRLQQLSSEVTSDAIKEKLEVPAYLRRNVALENVAPSSARNISRFNLSDDSDILGDNKFLHDNVD
jgi:cell division protein FtsZ